MQEISANCPAIANHATAKAIADLEKASYRDEITEADRKALDRRIEFLRSTLPGYSAGKRAFAYTAKSGSLEIYFTEESSTSGRFQRPSTTDFLLLYQPSAVFAPNFRKLFGPKPLALKMEHLEYDSEVVFLSMFGDSKEFNLSWLDESNGTQIKRSVSMIINRDNGQIFFYPLRPRSKEGGMLRYIASEAVAIFEGISHETASRIMKYRGEWMRYEETTSTDLTISSDYAQPPVSEPIKLITN
jgi:hypothetical protein